MSSSVVSSELHVDSPDRPPEPQHLSIGELVCLVAIATAFLFAEIHNARLRPFWFDELCHSFRLVAAHSHGNVSEDANGRKSAAVFSACALVLTSACQYRTWIAPSVGSGPDCERAGGVRIRSPN